MGKKAIPQICVATCPFTGTRWELETCWQSFSNTEVNSGPRETAVYLASQYCFSKPIDRRPRVSMCEGIAFYGTERICTEK